MEAKAVGGTSKKDPKPQGANPVHQMMIFEEKVNKETNFLRS
jgi:hypothetical protein